MDSRFRVIDGRVENRGNKWRGDLWGKRVLPCIWDNGFDGTIDPEKEHPLDATTGTIRDRQRGTEPGGQQARG